MTELYQILAGVGDIATIAIALGFWKLDRRLVIVETLLKQG